MIGVAMLAAPRAALADDDVAVATRAVCAGTDKTKLPAGAAADALARMCAPDVLARIGPGAPALLPPSFVEPQLCSDAGAVTPYTTASDAISALQRVCGIPRHAAGTPLTAVLVSVVSGLGDHIAAIARQDLIDYAAANLSKVFCKTDSTGLLALGDVFPITCRLFTQTQTQTPIDGLTLSSVKSTFLIDVNATGTTLLPKLEATSKDYIVAHPALAIIAGTGVAAAAATYEIFLAKLEPRQLLDLATSAILQQYPKPAPGARPSQLCSLATNQKDPVCLGILGALIVTRFEAAYLNKEDVAAEIPRLIDDAATELCAEHTYPAKADTSCVINPAQYTSWHAEIVRLSTALIALYNQQSLLAREPHSADDGTITRTSFPALAAALHEAFEAFVALCDVSDAGHTTRSLYVAVVDLALAAAQQDIAAIRTPLLQILDNAIVADKLGHKLDAATKSAVTFVTSLAAAKDSTEAQAVIATLAAPAGTYREKYSRGKLYFAAGAVIGPTVVWQDQLSGGSSTTAFVTRFSAPVGVELMPAALSGEWLNLGIAATLIDPLAMAASDTKGNTPDSNIGAVLDF
ncbi:MAG TPA: hypothetical protein VH165_34840, partial [Kofleriaceae bacterium]|nr:hypothetical protein [Kofleriaceae bacterium]